MKLREWLVGGSIVFLLVFFLFMTMQLDRISVNTSSVNTRLAALETSTGKIQTVGAQVTALKSDVDKLKTDITTIQTKLDALGTANQLSELKGTVDVLQNAVAPLGDEFGNVKSLLDDIAHQLDDLLIEIVQDAPNADGMSCVSAYVWSQAAKHANQTGIIFFKGPVVKATYTEGSAVIMNLGDDDHPKRLRVRITAENRLKFTTPPEEYYLGKIVCASGTLQWVSDGSGNQIAEIEIPSPEYITVIGKAPALAE